MTLEFKTVTFERNGKFVSIYPGHVQKDAFKKALNNEWCRPGSTVEFLQSELKHEWWERVNMKEWKPSEKGRVRALPVTVLFW